MARMKTKRFRGSRMHGRGKKAGRGSGLRGGRGMAGIHKHHRTSMLFIERETGKPYWGRVGFKRHPTHGQSNDVINVGRLTEKFPGETRIDLTVAGIDKLLGSGSVSAALTVTVDEASPSAVAKIEAAGGKVKLPGGDETG